MLGSKVVGQLFSSFFGQNGMKIHSVVISKKRARECCNHVSVTRVELNLHE